MMPVNRIFKIIGTALCLLLVSCHSDNRNGSELDSGLNFRPANQTCIAPEQGPLSSPAIEVQQAFPNLPDMGAIVTLIQAPGDVNQWYAVLQQGVIVRFNNNESANSTSIFLDIQSQVLSGGEQGLLGMAFHPNYTSNGEVYLYYSSSTPSLRSNISRFRIVNDVWEEEIILSVAQPYSNHNGGNIMFGPNDGYLYIGLGDGGSGNDPDGNGQNRNTLLGSMLRLDVDSGSPYTIPSDNPYFGNAMCSNPDVVINNDHCPEIFAYGLRNPWRWSFDRLSHELWLGDVGQGQVEEIDIISSGNNYGWNVMEGSRCVSGGSSCNADGIYELPVAEYLHNGGSASVVGGYVYRGNNNELSSLYGSYLFADTYNGKVFKTTIDATAQGSVYSTSEIIDTGLTIYSIAESLNGELFILAYSGSGIGNNIYKFVPAANTLPTSSIPSLLSETGCFESTALLTPTAGVIPYDIISPLWSDGAAKERYFAIPNNSQIDLTQEGDFIFPVGSVLIKNFYLNDKPIETRLMMRHQDYWGGYSYEWQYDSMGNPVDAQLLSDSLSKIIDGQNWLYPSRTQCFACHTQTANRSLGLETMQLNRDFFYGKTGKTENQLTTYQAIGLLSSTLTNNQRTRRLQALEDNSESHELRARSYLHSNCSYCHRPGGTTPTELDFMYTTSLFDMNACDIDPSEGDLGITGIKILDPLGSFVQPNSMMVVRMESIDPTTTMPPLGTEVRDDIALFEIKSWIDELVNCN